MLALVQMAKTAAAARRLKQARVPFISVLTDPTTGGVYASFAVTGDIILAEPDALIGFAGPRVIAAVAPGDAAHAEGRPDRRILLEHGWVDAIVERPRLRNVWRRSCSYPSCPGATSRGTPTRPSAASACCTHGLGRRAAGAPPERPTALDYIQRMLPQFVELHGDRQSTATIRR